MLGVMFFRSFLERFVFFLVILKKDVFISSLHKG